MKDFEVLNQGGVEVKSCKVANIQITEDLGANNLGYF